MKRLRLVFFGSGAFGLPTLDRLHQQHDLALIVSQPQRPAGRARIPTPTPVASKSLELGLPCLSPERIGDESIMEQIRGASADGFVVIAYGQKLPSTLLEGMFAINLHGSLLPKYRGAAPIQWAMMCGERETGITVITLAQRMDAGDILAMSRTPIDSLETAGELHDRLALLGPDAVESVLRDWQVGTLVRTAQDEWLATRAPKLTKANGRVSFAMDADVVRARIHGLTPWPGCRVRLGGHEARLHRVEVIHESMAYSSRSMGEVDANGRVICLSGAIRILEVHPPGGRLMSFSDFLRGHPLPPRAMCEPIG